MASKKVTVLTKISTAKNQALFYMVDPTRAVGDQSVGISKADLKTSLSADTTVISGGMVWVSGLTYESQNLSYSINGLVFVVNDGTQVTLDTAPSTPTEQRIDLIYGDNLGAIAISKGTASATPVANTLTFEQLQLTLVLIDTNGTEPEGVALETVYLEDAGQSAEWDATESTSGVRIDLASTLAPITSTKSIETLSGLLYGDSITLTTSTPISINDFQNLNFRVKLKSDFGLNYLTIKLQDSSTVVYTFFVYSNKLTTSDVTNVQDLIIFKNEFSEHDISGGDFDNIVIVANYTGGTEDVEFILDDIYINTDDGQVVPVNEFVKLSGDTMTGDLIVPAEAYGAGWNGSNEAPTKNDVYDKIETISVVTNHEVLILDNSFDRFQSALGGATVVKQYVIPANTIPENCILVCKLKINRLAGSGNPLMTLKDIPNGVTFTRGVNGNASSRHLVINDTVTRYFNNTGGYFDDLDSPGNNTNLTAGTIDRTIALTFDLDFTFSTTATDEFELQYLSVEAISI